MITLNYKDQRPIYEQIKENLRRHILSGVLKTGERLPSVRELAASLAINPNTIQRAYRELEGEGYIYSVTGKGSYVAQMGSQTDSRREALFKQLDEAAAELQLLGYTTDMLAEHLRTQERDKEDNNG